MDLHPNPCPNSDTISIFHLNIRSLRSKISYLSEIASEYDVLCLTETHLDENVASSELEIDGYSSDIIRKDRTAHGGGIALYATNKLHVERQTHLEINNIESIWVKITFPHFSFLLCCIYRPPSSTRDFWRNLHISLENAVTENQNIIVTGDLNTDMLTVRDGDLPDLIQYFQLTNVIHSPTRFGSTRASLLDPILVRECSVEMSEVIDIETC